MSLQVNVFSQRNLTAMQKAQLEDWFSSEFGQLEYRWAQAHWYLLASIKTDTLCRVGIIERVVRVDNQPVAVAGISGVITRPRWRGRNIASLVLQQAAAFIKDKLNLEFGLLLCRQQVAPVYKKLGWKIVKGPTLFSQPGGQKMFPNLTMVLECGENSWPPGAIDLRGLPW